MAALARALRCDAGVPRFWLPKLNAVGLAGTSRITAELVSAINRLPCGSRAIACGLFNCALVARLPSLQDQLMLNWRFQSAGPMGSPRRHFSVNTSLLFVSSSRYEDHSWILDCHQRG